MLRRRGKTFSLKPLLQNAGRAGTGGCRSTVRDVNANFERLVKIHGIEDRVDFLGHIPKITEAWLDHHVLVLLSRTEGLPIAVVEAMLCGRIVVATAVAGNAEVIEDGVTGFLAAAPTVHHFSEALERAWEVRSNWSAFGERGARRIRALVPEDPVLDVTAMIKMHFALKEDR